MQENVFEVNESKSKEKNTWVYAQELIWTKLFYNFWSSRIERI